VAVAVVNALP
jgi:hypothetical protein